MSKIMKIITTCIVIVFWSFLWWVCGFNFNERGFTALLYIVSTIWLSLIVYAEL